MQIHREILDWFDQHGRKHLPWQQDKTPYRVWVSEIMLQQTQVATVIAYFERFMQRFPTLESLALAKEDDVLHLWSGLGYYTRARNLHRAAIMVMETFQGEFPSDLESLQQLPGIGRSTAAAILAIAFQKRATILDGNVKRVLSRLYAIETWPDEKETLNTLWDLAEKLTPIQRVNDYTQAIMDIGATICVRGKPLCEDCPVKRKCAAKKLNIAATLPKPRPRKIPPARSVMLLVLQHEDAVLLEKRPARGIWGGLWSLPEVASNMHMSALKKYCRETFNLTATEIQHGETFRHTFTHFHLDILPVFIECKARADAPNGIWYNPRAARKIGLPAPVKKLLELLHVNTSDSL
ncbi:MAG: A/G-specific adenine glycosylase [Gammaproteobacteria bacterium]|nr:A/G-specific adenine glycosylase [Gammaproteobacteria bacterium]